MKTISDITDEAITQLKAGISLEEVLSKYPDNRKELQPLLYMASELFAVPKKSVTAATMQRKFLVAPKPANIWLAWLHVSRFAAVSASVMLLIVGISGTAYAAFKSLPGQILFPVRRTAEKIQVSFTTNPEAKANLQVALTQQRLTDAKQIFSTPDHTPDQEKAALKELSDQTNETISTVSSSENAGIIQKKNHPLVASLAGLAQQQEDLLNQIKPKTDTHSEVASAANTALVANQEVSKFIQVIAATNGSGVIADLSASSSVITISGVVNHISKSEISVNKETFTITDKTLIMGTSTNTTLLGNIFLKTNVIVQGIKNATGTIATSITIQKNSPEQGLVKGDYTEANSTAFKTGTGSPTQILKKTEQKDQTDTTVLAPSSTEAIGTFIAEDPAPQFVP